jgi:hypothetical protein
MSERQNTIVCVFDLKSPRVSAYEIHEWIYEQMSLQEKMYRWFRLTVPNNKFI